MLGLELTNTLRDDEIRKFLGLDKTHWEIVYAVTLGISPEAIEAPAPSDEPEAGDQWRG